MIRGSEVPFVKGEPYKVIKNGTKNNAAILKKSIMCVKCHKYRAIQKGYQKEGDICRYCTGKKVGPKLKGKQKLNR